MPDDLKFRGPSKSSAKPPAPPPKKSVFERQKAEAEAKRVRDKAETAAVYEDFVKSFEDSGSPRTPSGVGERQGTYGGHGARGSGPPGGPSKRHFTGSSTLASLGPQHSMLGKRTHDGSQASHRDRDGSRGILGFESFSGAADRASAFQMSDEEEEKAADKKEAERAAAKPTLHLSSLPPGTSPAVIKALIPPVLAVDNVKILPPSHHQTGGERRIWSAIVTLSKETAATDMDTVVSSLQNKYLGWGYYLSISRHLSSAAIHSAVPVTPGMANVTSQPFGARPAPYGPASSLSRAPPPELRRPGFAPPASYDSGHGSRHGQNFQVDVKPPSDLKQLKLIHKTLESLLTYGPEFEALLMSRPEVQKDEKWAWIWNSRCAGGVWYRWKLWDVLTRSGKKSKGHRTRHPPTFIFDHGPGWIAPETDLQFEYTTKVDDFVSDDDYDSSEEDDSDREDEKRANEVTNESHNEGTGHLNPLQRAKLAHLLARLPTTNARLRRGDVARVTAFAIKHAGEGTDEVVDMIVSNVKCPLAFTSANPDWRNNETEASGGNRDDANDADDGNADGNGTKPSQKENLDTSAAKLVGLYVISDILSSSSTSGVRHAWKYRQLFENAFKTHRIFEHLGRLEKDLRWGRLKIEKWRRSVGVLLNLWEGWCVFPQSSQEHFLRNFEEPPLTEKEMEEENQATETQKAPGVFGSKVKSRWKTLDDTTTTANAAADGIGDARHGRPADDDLDGAPMEADADDLDGEPMSDIDGVPMEDSDMEDDDGASDVQDEGVASNSPAASQPAGEPEAEPIEPASGLPPRRPRPKAEDMFADSDSEPE